MSETEAGTVAVIDQTGRHHYFDADDWHVGMNGYLDVTRDGKDDKPVASFAPGFMGVYRSGARAAVPTALAPVGAGGGGGAQ